jgi:ferredoxin
LVTLTINGHTSGAALGATLFDCAESMGVRVPTSCLKNGKCKECVVEVAEGMECLSPPTPCESHLTGNFRLSCQTSVACDAGRVRCHTMRRGHMRIETPRPGAPGQRPPDGTRPRGYA